MTRTADVLPLQVAVAMSYISESSSTVLKLCLVKAVVKAIYVW
jgi:hypothetical protein